MLNNSDLSNHQERINGVLLGPEFIVSSHQPALGMVYKIMQINDKACIKFSEDKSKQTIPGFKNVLRLFDSEDNLIGDLLCLQNEIDDYHHIYEFKA
jgi:nicotinate phosphoribosyltransferase